MKRLLLPLVLTCVVSAFTVSPAVADVVAFVDTTVLPMDSDRVLENHTVLVEGDRITAVRPKDTITVPAGAQVIDGRGKFLMPGLGEMHGHNPSPGSSEDYVASIYLLYVANGVTTVRSMLGWPGQLELRDKVRSGQVLGPTLLLAGHSFSGQTVPSPESAIRRVKEQKGEGWDLLKVHPGVRRDVYDAMVRTAKEVEIEFSGHVPADVGLEHALRSGQTTIDHLDGYIEFLGAQDGPIDPARLEAIVQLTLETKAWVVPTMVLWETILGAADLSTMLAYPELRYMPPAEVERWRTGYERRTTAAGFNADQARRIAENRKVLLRALAKNDVRILFGTDSPQVFSVPGFSVHREMLAMVEAGLSNYAVLASATRTVGDYLAATDRFGQVAPGHRADLILLEANPLDDVRHISRRAGVLLRGQWLPEEQLQGQLRELEAKYRDGAGAAR